MKTRVHTLIIAAALVLPAFGVAQSYQTSNTGAANTPAAVAAPAPQVQFQLRIGDAPLQTLLTRIRTNAQSLLNTMYGPGQGRGRGLANRRDNDVTYLLNDLVQTTAHLTDHVGRRVVTREDVEGVLQVGHRLEATINQGSWPQATAGWARLRRDLDELGRAYVPPMDWRNPVYGQPRPPFPQYETLSGTYRLDPARSQDPRRAMNTILSQVAQRDRDRVSRQLSVRLDPPDVLAINRNARHVQIASSRGPRLEFDADGRPDVQTGPAGATITTRASLFGDQLQVTTTGGPGIDYSVTFEPTDNGRSLIVTREIFDESLRQPVSVRSVYTRTAEQPDWNVYSGPPIPPYPGPGSPRGGRNATGFLVPSGATLVATLDRPLDLRVSRQGDRVTLTVRDQGPLDGAVIEGFLVGAPSRSSNRYALALDFDRIRLRDGRTGDFEGKIQEVRIGGRVLDIDRNETLRDTDRSDEAVGRGILGAALGALVGAVAGGGKGAAIGAAIGAAGGAGTVFIDGPNVTELPRGAAFTIRSRAWTP